jgi:hypothetical protein
VSGRLSPRGCPTEALASATRVLAGHFPGPGRYGIAYGSHACGTHGPRSDLDLLQVAPAPPVPDQARHLQDAVIRLHHDHGLDLDTEVAYEVKLIATHCDVQAALDHAPFPWPDSPEQPLAPAVPPDAAYLNSATFKQRLILNALTSPNIFLGGDLATFARHRDAAEASLALLAMRIIAHRWQQDDLPAFRLSDALHAVTRGPGGVGGQDFLGYHPSAALLATLNRGLHRLIGPGIAAADQAAVWCSGPGWTGPPARACPVDHRVVRLFDCGSWMRSG